MKWVETFNQIFGVEQLQKIDPGKIWEAISDNDVRKLWIEDVFGELQNLNLKADDLILSGDNRELAKLSGRRKALQEVLEKFLTIHGRLKHQKRNE